MVQHAPSRTLVTLAITTLGLLVAASPAVAHPADDGGDGHRGKVGKHRFIDSKDRPGARCIYRAVEPTVDARVDQITYQLVGMAARPPRVRAANRRDDRNDRQLVGWRFVVQARKIGDVPTAVDGWTRIARSRLQVAVASERRSARFSRMRTRVKGETSVEYRVVTKAYWFARRRPRRVTGLARHVIDFYRIRESVEEISCPGMIVP